MVLCPFLTPQSPVSCGGIGARVRGVESAQERITLRPPQKIEGLLSVWITRTSHSFQGHYLLVGCQTFVGCLLDVCLLGSG